MPYPSMTISGVPLPPFSTSLDTPHRTLMLDREISPQAIEFINSHATEVMDTTGWKQMVLSQPSLVADAFRALATQQVRRSSEAGGFLEKCSWEKPGLVVYAVCSLWAATSLGPIDQARGGGS
jgi:hypothetical protein